MKNIVVVVEGGIIQNVYCPNESYSVHILDLSDTNEGDEVSQYYQDVQDFCVKLVDCTSI